MVYYSDSLKAQTWSYDMGTDTGTHSSGTSTSFLPDPVSGNDFVRVGSGGGAIILENPGSVKIGSKSELIIKASSTTSYNKTSVYDYSSGTSFYIKFSFLLGDSAGGTTASDGTVTFILGDGNNFSNSSNYSSSETFTGIRWYFGSNGSISTRYLNGSSWNAFSGVSISQGNVYSIEIIGNNSSTLISYIYNGNNFSVGANSQDIIINGQLAGNDLNSSNLSAGSPIDSWMIIAGSSTSNLAHIFIDDLIYSNSIDTMYESDINYYASTTGYIDSLTTWNTNKDGSGNVIPLSFNESYTSFHIYNNSNPSICNDWAVTGNASEVILGDGISSCLFSTGIFNLGFNDLIINTYSQLVVVGGQRVTVSGDVILNDTNCIYLQSPVGVDAAGSFICEGTVSGSGSIKIDRYIEPYTSSGNGWHLLASPVTNQQVFNDATDLYSFNEPTNVWINYNGGSFADTIFITGKGYLIAYSSAVTKQFSGIPNNDDLILNIFSNPTLSITTGQGDGWNLVGNPFTSAIDWDQISRTDIDGAVYIWNGVQYDSWNGSVGNISNGIIPSMQGFFIKVNGSNPELIIEKTDRIHASQKYYKTEPANLIELVAEGNGLSDHMFIHYRNDASLGFDNEIDAYKLYGAAEAPQIYSEIPGEKLSINSLPLNGSDSIIQIGFEAGYDGEQSIKVKGISSFISPYGFILEDLKDGVYHNLELNSIYFFQASVNDNPQRFRLHIKAINGIGKLDQSNLNICFYENKIIIDCRKSIEEVVVIDVAGKEIIRMNGNGQMDMKVDVSNYPNGYYFVNVLADKQRFTKKMLLINAK
ncbi:T9SS type A sorting domain-containing protein [Bacteroidota bacterium]